MKTMRQKVLDYAKKTYGDEPDRPFSTAPTYEVLRHAGSRKWYALFMDIPARKLGLASEDIVDIINLKCDPAMSGSLRDGVGIFPAYHMNRDSWITVLLNGTVPLRDIKPLLDISRSLTAQKQSRPARARITDWLIPANPKFYDVEEGLAESPDGTVLWKQSSDIRVGDTVYMYMAAPVSAVRYKFTAREVNIPWEYADENVTMKRAMRLKLLERYDAIPIGRDVLQNHGVYAVRGPRGMPRSLVTEISELYRKK